MIMFQSPGPQFKVPLTVLPHIRIFLGTLGKFQAKIANSGTSSERQSAKVILPGRVSKCESPSWVTASNWLSPCG